jgi:hypothetical protein
MGVYVHTSQQLPYMSSVRPHLVEQSRRRSYQAPQHAQEERPACLKGSVIAKRSVGQHAQRAGSEYGQENQEPRPDVSVRRRESVKR